MYYVTKQNLLDLIQSHGLEMKMLMCPDCHPYSDAKRAEPYEARYKAAQTAWRRVVQSLKMCNPGPHANHMSLWEHALLGHFEKDEAFFRTGSEKFANHDWVTYKGDFYSVDFGNYLNIPRVHRIANEHLPEERCKLDGAQEIAGMMPNPCTRVSVQIQVS
jgi:hypothetical protein